MTGLTVPVSYRGGPRCGTPGAAVQLTPHGVPPLLISARYGHAADCRCDPDFPHTYQWRPEVEGAARPARRERCCAEPRPGCPMYEPKAGAT